MYYGNSLSPYFENCMDICFTWNIWETHNFGVFGLSHTSPVLWEFIFLMFWELRGFLLYPKYLKETCNFGTFVFLHTISRNMGIRFSHILGIFLISASPKIFKKLIILECLCFPMLFPHYGDSVFPCFEKSTHLCSTLSILGNPSLGFFLCLFHIFFCNMRIHFFHTSEIACVLSWLF